MTRSVCALLNQISIFINFKELVSGPEASSLFLFISLPPSLLSKADAFAIDPYRKLLQLGEPENSQENSKVEP